MPIVSLTGSATSRFQEIEDRQIVFEPISSEKFYQNPLYTVPIGQTFAPEMIFNTGSFVDSTGSVVVEKIIHTFESETEASNFINEVGEANIASIVRRPFLRDDGTSYFKTDVHLINYPFIEFDVILNNSEVERGFKIEVFFSGETGLTKIGKEPLFNSTGEITLDTYLKFFEIIPE